MAALVAMLAPAAGNAKTLPADFAWAPDAPSAGQPATLTVPPQAAGVAIALWDLDGDDVFDAVGTTVTTTFAAPGAHVVRLQVFDDGGHTGTAVHTIAVGPPPPPPPPPPPLPVAAPPPALMAPFPVVRILGRLLRRGVVITRFVVHAPAGAIIRVTCASRGHGCPATPAVHVSRSAARGLRVQKFERRLRAGAIVQVYVSDARSIGKYTSFRVRRRGPPFRRDLCVAPSGLLPSRCPGG